VQDQQFPVAATNLLFSSLAFGDVQQKSLVRSDGSGYIANCDRGFHHGADFSVPRAQLELIVSDRTMILKKLFQAIPVLRIYIEQRNINRQQGFPSWIAAYPQKGVIKIQEMALRRGDENTFLNIGNECPVLFFCALPLSYVFEYMDRSQSVSGRVRKS